MSRIANYTLTGVPETLLITLYIRALESQRPDALLRDERAMALVRQIDFDPMQILSGFSEESRVATVLRSREFDRWVTDFLVRSPEPVVVQIGCGLDTRFERVDNGKVEWYDLDVPKVIELRRSLLGEVGPRQHYLACSAFDNTWLDAVGTNRRRQTLFLAEGVLMYFREAQVKSLVSTLREHSSGAELICDAFSPFLVWVSNLGFALSHIGARFHWGLKRGVDLEGWCNGIRLLQEWFPYATSEPRLLNAPKVARAPWVLRIPLLARASGVFHYRLGEIHE